MAKGNLRATIAVRGFILVATVGLLAALFWPDSPSEDPDLLEGGWYRANHSRALLHLPPLDPAIWHVQNPRPGRLVMRWQPNDVATAELTLIVQAPEEFPDPKDQGRPLAERLAEIGASSIQKSLPFLARTKPRPLSLSDGVEGVQISLTGKMDREPLEQQVWVLAQGKQVASLVTVARGNCIADTAVIASGMVGLLRIGTQVPRLAPRNPATKLDGVYVGPVESGSRTWIVFDERGYASTRAPTTRRFVDLEALHQTSEGVSPVSTYEVKDGNLELTAMSGGAVTKHKVELGSGKLAFDGREYVRVDGARGSRDLTGRYRMRDGGTVLSFAPSPGRTCKREQGTKLKNGTYLVVGDRIRFAWNGGGSEVWTIFSLGDSLLIGAAEFQPEK